MTKICTKCKVEKPIVEFYKQPGRHDGLTSNCRSCKQEQSKLRVGTTSCHRLYHVWEGMRSRCNCKSHASYAIYGGRGIQVCSRWNSFTNFLEDIPGWKEGLTLDRIDNNGNYSPENCRWANRSIQSMNRNKFTLEANKILPGVRKFRNKWQSKMIIDNCVVYLGTFNTEMEAHTIYIKTINEFYGFVPDALNPRKVEIS